MNIIIDEKLWKFISEDTKKGQIVWHDGQGVTLFLHSIGFDHALYSRLNDEMAARAYYRDNFADQDIGLVECDIVKVGIHQAVKTLGKHIQHGLPARYVGSLAIPMPDRSFVLSLYSEEIGVTGIRETAVLNMLSADGYQIESDSKSGKMLGWTQDPYFPEYIGPCLRNLSDAEAYDIQFPDHPLSKVRARLNELAESVALID